MPTQVLPDIREIGARNDQKAVEKSGTVPAQIGQQEEQIIRTINNEEEKSPEEVLKEIKEGETNISDDRKDILLLDERNTSQETLADFPLFIREPVSVLLKAIGLLNKAESLEETTDLSLASSELGEKASSIFLDLINEKDSVKILESVKKLISLKKICETKKAQIEKEKRGEEDEVANFIIGKEKELKEKHVAEDQQEESEDFVFYLNKEKTKFEEELTEEEGKPFYSKLFSGDKRRILREKIAKIDLTLNEIAKKKQEFVQKEGERKNALEELSSVPELGQIKKILLEKTTNIAVEIKYGINNGVKEVFKDNEFVSDLVRSFVEQSKYELEGLLKEGKIKQEDIEEFIQLTSEGIVTHYNDGYANYQKVHEFKEKTRGAFNNLNGINDVNIDNLTGILKAKYAEYTLKQILSSIKISNLTSEQRRYMSDKFRREFDLSKIDKQRVSSWNPFVGVVGLTQLKIYLAIRDDSRVKGVFSGDGLEEMNKFFEDILSSNLEMEINEGSLGVESSSMVPQVISLCSSGDFESSKKALLFAILNKHRDRMAARIVSDFLDTEKGEKFVGKLLSKFPGVSSGKEEIKDSLNHEPEESKLAGELAKRIVLSSEENIKDRALAMLVLRRLKKRELLNQIFTSDTNKDVRDLAGRSLVVMGREKDGDYFKVFDGLGINRNIQSQLLEKYLAEIPLILEGGEGIPIFHIEHHYNLLKILAENPPLMERFLEGKPLWSLTLIATREEYLKLGKILTTLTLQEIPSYDELFDFVTKVESWPDEWENLFNISNISGLDSHVQWNNLSPERKREMLNNSEEFMLEELASMKSISSDKINKKYGLILVKNILKHIIEDSQNQDKKRDADLRNRETVRNRVQPLIPGTLLHGTSIDSLRQILKSGDRAGEFLGQQLKKDATPFSCDFSQVRKEDFTILPETRKLIQDEEGIKELEETADFSRAYYQSIAAGYGARPNINRGVAVDVTSEEDTGITMIFDRSSDSAFLKGMEYEGTMREQHKLLLVGMPGTETSGVIINSKATETLEKAKKEITENGFYVPIYDVDGTLLFTPEEYDKQLTTVI